MGVNLKSFLACCNESWGPRDLRAVQQKLGSIGVVHVDELLRLEREGLLNELLDAAGERRFAGETLAAIREAGKEVPPSPAVAGSVGLEGFLQRAPLPMGMRSGDSDSEEDEEINRLLDSFLTEAPVAGRFARNSASAESAPIAGRFARNSASAESSRHSASASSLVHRGLHFNASDTLQRQVNRGMAYIDEAAKEAHMRNADLSRCLEEVQKDISRISERMQAARRERARGRTAVQSAAQEFVTSSKLSGSSSSSATSSAAQQRAAAGRAYSNQRLPSEPMPRTGSRSSSHGTAKAADGRRAPQAPPRSPCTRAAQAGFSFGAAAARPPRFDLIRETDCPDRRAKDSVIAQLAAARSRSEAEQKAVVKRLLVKWHPDRNPESTKTATAMFQFIQQEKEQMLGL
eukprot:TRINITY_DN3510_c0_g1_i1.p1 TRINITY_DN3510_c0_g1~~TRINITY_DN3510_c0_g1_i1.p1  ORF type:complete len:404 (+),score=82.31 TRINITY_DN3510_c0_g1_i1:26-1237(+)